MPTAKQSRRQSAQQDFGVTGIWSHSLLIVGFGGLGLVTAFLLLWWQLVASSNETHREVLAQRHLAAFTAVTNGRIADLRDQVTRLARSPEVVQAVIASDPAAPQVASRLLTALVGHARRVEIIPKGKASIDQNAAVPISYAALDVINRADTAAFVGPEGATLEGRSYLYAAAPITHEGLAVGTLFVALAPDYFADTFKQFDADVGSVSIAQSLDGGAPKQLVTWGSAAPDATSLSRPLSNGSWTLDYAPSRELQEPVAEFTDLITAFAVALVMLLGGVTIGYSTLGRRLRTDAANLTDFARGLLRGRANKPENYRLPIFHAMAAELYAQQPRTSSQKAPRPIPKEASAAELLAEDDDDVATRLLAEQPAANPPPAKTDDDFLEVGASAASEEENFGIEVSEDVGPVDLGLDINPSIFRAYDIRGIVEQDLTPDVVYWIGRAFASEAQSLNQTRVAVGRDGRHSSEQLRDSLIRGLTDSGMEVLDVGLVPTPMLYFATHALDTGTGIMITGSHNPPEYNGLKMMIDGVTLAEDRITGLYERISSNRLTEGDGDVEVIDLEDHYIDRILEDVAIAQPLKVVVDCGNGVAGVVAPRLLEELGCEVIPLYCEVDGDFPNHHPDPADPANLEDLITVVKAEGAQLGVAFDGDGDRLGVVTPKGEIIWPDKLLMLFAQDVVSRNPGADIIYDVKCSRHLNTIISENGGRPIMWKTGHSHIKAKMKDSGALLGGEFSGHICFGERWYGFDDAIYAAARLIEILGSETKDADELFAQFPVTFSTPEIKVPTSEDEKFKIIGRLANDADFGDGTLTSIDGVRVDYTDGWGLVRASNTSPVLTLRFEADGQAALDRIQGLFQDCLTAIDPQLKFR